MALGSIYELLGADMSSVDAVGVVAVHVMGDMSPGMLTMDAWTSSAQSNIGIVINVLFIRVSTSLVSQLLAFSTASSVASASRITSAARRSLMVFRVCSGNGPDRALVQSRSISRSLALSCSTVLDDEMGFSWVGTCVRFAITCCSRL